MAGRPSGSDDEFDDWFAGLDQPLPAPAQADDDGDDWLAEPVERAERRGLGDVGRVWLVGGIVVVVLLVVLAAAGVFSGGSKAPATIPTTTQPASTTPPVTTTAPKVSAVPTTTLKPGATGAQVRALQRALKSLGYSPGTIDGVYGPSTQQAVKNFQQANGLTVDGILGPKTLDALVRRAGP
jgi:Putative peptidoglycan binding domain